MSVQSITMITLLYHELMHARQADILNDLCYLYLQKEQRSKTNRFSSYCFMNSYSISVSSITFRWTSFLLAALEIK